MSERVDCIVVGSGIGGLSTALSLARQGHSVRVIEAAKQLGGMLNPFKRKGYHFDVGIHYVGEAGPRQLMRRGLDSLGLEHVAFREIDPDCIDRYVFDGYEAVLVKGAERWIDGLVRDFPGEETGIRSLATLMEAVDAFMRVLINGPNWQDAKTSIIEGRELARLMSETFAELLDRHLRDPLLKAVFAGPAGDLGVPPSRASAFVSLGILNHYLGGAYFPVGGGGAMRDAFVTALEARGALLHKNAPVTRIDVMSDGFAVHARGEIYEARSVVSNADVALTLGLLSGADVPGRIRDKVERLKPSLGACVVYAATDLDIAALGMTDANIWHYGTSDIDACYAELYAGRVPDEPFFILTSPSLKDPEGHVVPNGHQTVEIITMAPGEPFRRYFDGRPTRRGDDYAAMKETISERLLAGAERYLPGLRDHLVLSDSSTPATVWHFVRGVAGGIYGPELSPDQSVFRRFTPSVGVPGLYLTGASTLGPGIMTCLLAGILAGHYADNYLRRGALAPLTTPTRILA